MGNLVRQIQFFLLALLCSQLTSCDWDQPPSVGYVEADFTYIAGNVGGTLSVLAIKRGQEVKKGELLYVLDSEPELSSVRAALANIGNLNSQVNFFKQQLDRQTALYAKKATSQMELENAQASYDSYSKQLAAVKANLAQTQWALDQKTVTAPVDGRVFDTYYVLGEKIPQFRPVLSLLNPENIHIIFFVPEERLASLKFGQKVTVNCDSCESNIEATIEYISPQAQYTPPLVYSKDSRATLVFMVRARLTGEAAKTLHPGQPVDIAYNS